MTSLPETHKALVLSSFDSPLEVKSIATPELIPGSCIVRILSTPILSYASKLYSGSLKYPLHPPQTIGGGAIGRIVSVANDATSLRPGQLVLIDSMCWRDGSYAEFARWPLENVHALDEEKLKGLGYGFGEMAYLLRLLVPTGGIFELDVKAGDRVVIAPASGQFGGAAVEVALAMAADVIICGRQGDLLEKMKSTLGSAYPQAKIDVVQLTGTVEADVPAIQSCGPVDKYLDFSPATAAGSTHIMSCLMSLKKGGKACFMGGITQSVQIPYPVVMFNDLKICGKFMYEREGVRKVISLVEGGRLRFALPALKVFGLEEWEEGFRAAEESGKWREMAVLEPGRE